MQRHVIHTLDLLESFEKQNKVVSLKIEPKRFLFYRKIFMI